MASPEAIRALFGLRSGVAARPASLPNGRPWPRLRVMISPTEDGADLARATVASVLAEAYPSLRCDLLPAPPTGADLGRAAAGTDYLLLLRAGDLVAPGALAALCLEAWLTGAEAVTGLRVRFDHAPHSLDAVALPVHGAAPSPDLGTVLFAARGCLALAEGGACPSPRDLWRMLVAAGRRLARVGRPVLLQPALRDGSRPLGLTIAALTDLGHQGGAGIAHRRLTEALALAGHRVRHHRLADEALPQGAEWTHAFPRTEAAILGEAPDLVLAGNLHGATRSLAFLARLAQETTVAAVLHDLFALTGRCTHPKACPRIASGCDSACPTSTEYPQATPKRIAGLHAEKRAVLGAPRAPILLANSAWTEARARTLAPPDARIAPIALAFPCSVFRPRDRADLRRQLGLPVEDVLVLFSAVIADAPDKGFDDLAALIRRTARPGVAFVAVGRLDRPGAFGAARLFAPGPIADEARLAEWYAACDIHLTASRLETLGQTAIEAGLCGVPTVAYRLTGLTSAVLDGVTGLLAAPEPGALAAALETLIADAPRRHRMGLFSRIAFESRFSPAAAVLSLHEALAGAGAVPAGAAARVQFDPGMLAAFTHAHPASVATDTVAPPSRVLVRLLRRSKHRLLGRGLPHWLRPILYAAALARRELRRSTSGR